MARSSKSKVLTERMQIRLRTAAELKAAGSSWATIAEKVGCHINRCRHWPIEHRVEWHNIYLQFKQQHFAEAAIEARILLHRLMRETKDERVRLASIRVVLLLDSKLCEPFEKLLYDLSQDQEALRMAQYYLSLDDATRKKLLGEMLRQCLVAAGAEQAAEPVGLLAGPETAACAEPQRGVMPQPGASPLEPCTEPQRGVIPQPGASPLEEGRNLHL